MAQFSYAPSLADVGNAPPGMTIGGQADGATVTVIDAGGGVPAIQFLGGAGTRRRRISWTDVAGPGSFADGETYCRFLSAADGGVINGGPAIRTPGDTSTSCASYYLRTEVGVSTTTGRVSELNSSSTNTNFASTDNSPIPATNGDLMHAIIRVQGDQVSGKIWKDGDAEPAFTGPFTDPSLTAGYAGFIVYSVPNTQIFFIGVGTGTDSAPRSAAPAATDVSLSLTTGNAVTAVDATTPTIVDLAITTGNAVTSLSATTPTVANIALTTGNAVAAISVTAGGAPNDIRLTFGMYVEQGGVLGAVVDMRYVVLSDDLTSVVQSGLVTTNSSGVASIDVDGSPWAVGDYAPVLIASYNSALAPYERTVKSGLMFVPAVAQA